MPSDFFDRLEEIALFENILAKKTHRQIIAYILDGGKGKTYLLQHLREISKQYQTPAALVDFDTRQRGVISYWKFINLVCDELGWDYFQQVNTCQYQQNLFYPNIQIHTSSGEGSIDFGSGGRFDEADIQKISGRDLIEFTYHEAGKSSAERQERQMYAMGRAFRSDLNKICRENRVVLLLDTYEHTSTETRNWLNEWLFASMEEKYPGLVVILAGRQELHEHLDQAKHLKSLMYIRKEFSAPKEGDVRGYIESDKFKIQSDDMLRLFMNAARDDISLLAQLRDLCNRQYS